MVLLLLLLQHVCGRNVNVNKITSTTTTNTHTYTPYSERSTFVAREMRNSWEENHHQTYAGRSVHNIGRIVWCQADPAEGQQKNTHTGDAFQFELIDRSIDWWIWTGWLTVLLSAKHSQSNADTTKPEAQLISDPPGRPKLRWWCVFVCFCVWSALSLTHTPGVTWKGAVWCANSTFCTFWQSLYL